MSPFLTIIVGMNDVLIGNLTSLFAMVTDSISGTRHKQKSILFYQSISQIFYGVSSIILKGYSSAVQNAVGILRNIAAIKRINSKVLEWTLVLMGVVLGVAFNNRGLLGLVPVVANFEYSVCVFRFKDNEKGLKISFVIDMVMFAFFNVMILNYVGALACIMVGITTVLSLIHGNPSHEA